MAKHFPYYPIFLDIENRNVVIIGGGEVCTRKAETVMRYGAKVTIVSPEVTSELEEWERKGQLTIHRKRYETTDIEDAHIVIASTDDMAVNERVAADARALRIPVNVVDVTNLCEFIVPAIVEKDGIQIAISTAGKSPALARTLKEDLNRTVGPEYAEINDLLGSLRDSAKATLPTDIDRKRFFDGIIASGVLPRMREGKRKEAYRLIADACDAAGVAQSEQLKRGL
ncbi:MAG TPA: bifunctional precorrin-2 dehydrogenase/sirohydrochlorin ferrochelatase [Thermoanaerobaculia bacterium]|jgi:siroheme synthase-like protein